MDRSAQNIDRSSDSEIMNLRRMMFLFDRSAQNIDRSSDSEIMNLRRMKFLFDVAPLEIIDNNDEEFLLFDDEEDENFFHGGGVGVGVGGGAVGMNNINQINLVIQVISHGLIFQYWSLKSDHHHHQQQLCYGGQHHRDHHHLREDDDDKEMIIISCQPLDPLKTTDIVLDREGGGVYASSAADDDYIMSQLRDLDILYEMEWIFKPEQLEGVKRCIIQRINESKPAVLLAKPKAVRIRLDLSSILKIYYANPAAAASAYAKRELFSRTVVAVDFATHYPDPPKKFLDYDDAIKLCQTTALKLSKEALETKILEEEDLISSSSSSSSCSVCLNEFHVGVDEIKKMPCSHMFHLNCLENWLWKSNTCPLCRHGLPTLWSRFLEDQLP